MRDLPTGETASAAPVTIKEMDDLAKAIFDQKAKIEEMEKAVSEENKQLASMEQKFAAYLEETGREKYQHPMGTLYFKETWRFSLPQSDEDKQAFFSWLKDKGIFDKYVTVNSNSYNSLLLREWEIAKEEGRAMEFSVPGVPEPKFFRTVSSRKGK